MSAEIGNSDKKIITINVKKTLISDFLGIQIDHDFLGKDGKRSNRHWFFTSYRKDGNGKLVEPEIPENKVRYMIYQEEICPSTGNHHLQGYLELIKETGSIRKVQEWLGLGMCHMEMVRDIDAAMAYCRKTRTAVPGTLMEFGTRKKQGSNEGNVVQIENVVLRGGTQLDCYKIVGSAHFTAGADRVRLATMSTIAKHAQPIMVAFLNEQRLSDTCRMRSKDSMYHCYGKFSRMTVYNYDGENIFVVRKSADWYMGELRADCEWRKVWLPRKGLPDIPLIASEIWYPENEYDMGEKTVGFIDNILNPIFGSKILMKGGKVFKEKILKVNGICDEIEGYLYGYKDYNRKSEEKIVVLG